MSAPHRDLPPGSQKWAEQVDALMDRVQQLEALGRRLATDARVDPSDPSKNINPAGDPPSVQSPVQTRITQHSDVKAFNVADGQVLTWSQADQAFTPQSAGDGFVPDPSTYQYSDFGYGLDPAAEGHNVGAGTQWGFVATTDQEVFATAHDNVSLGGSNAQSRRADLYLGGGEAYIRGYIPSDVATAAAGASAMAEATPFGLTLNAQKGADGSGGEVAVNAPWFLIPVYGTSLRPAATGKKGAVLYDATLNTVVASDGASWNALGGGGSDEFTPPSGTPFSFSGTDPQAEGHNTGSSGQYGFMATSDREVYLAANDATYGDANVYMGNASVIIQSDAPGTSSDWDMYSEAVVAKDGLTLKSIPGSGTGAGGIVKVVAHWFQIPTYGVSTRPAATGKAGAMYLDIGLNKPAWSDGTNWRDATGTIV